MLGRVVSFMALFGVYLLLVTTLTADELAAGSVTALLATGALLAVRGNSRRRFAIRRSWLLRLLPLPWGILRESVMVLRAAFGPVPRGGLGRSATIAFRSDTGLPGPQEAGRRALVLGGLSATPNAYVVVRERGPDGRGGTLLMHQLVQAKLPGGDPAWPS